MPLFVLLTVCLLLGPAGCDIHSAGVSAESGPPQLTASAGTTDSSPPTARPQGSVSPEQVIAELVGFCQFRASAALEGPLAKLTETLTELIRDSQDEQQRLQTGLSERMDALWERVDTALQQQQRVAASGSAAAQHQTDDIQTADDHTPNITLGSECSSDRECSRTVPEALCGRDGRCRCREGYRRVSDTLCRGPSRLTEPCLEDHDCQFLVNNSTCAMGICICTDGFWNNNNSECRRASAVNKGGPCVGDQDCDSVQYLGCIAGTCLCPLQTAEWQNYQYLIGGGVCNEGNVELRITGGGSWGHVCDDAWGDIDAHVFCRSLGFRTGNATVEGDSVHGTNFHMDNVYCIGSESHLMDCSYNGWGNHNCERGEVAGVHCRN